MLPRLFHTLQSVKEHEMCFSATPGTSAKSIVPGEGYDPEKEPGSNLTIAGKTAGVTVARAPAQCQIMEECLSVPSAFNPLLLAVFMAPFVQMRLRLVRLRERNHLLGKPALNNVPLCEQVEAR